MYRFSYVNKIAGKAVEVDKEMFHQIISDERVKKICEKIAQTSETEEIGKLKRLLPAFCWHAWFDEGKRKNYKAHASGLIMLDLDHISSPRELFENVKSEKLTVKSEDGSLWCGDYPLLVAHVTPSTKGLRLVFPVPKGMDIVGAQMHYVKALKLKNVDACTKDLARLSVTS